MKITDKDIAHILRLHKQGEYQADIAKLVGIHHSSVSRIIYWEGRPPVGASMLKPVVPDKPKEPIKRPKALYSNPSREDYVERALKMKA